MILCDVTPSADSEYKYQVPVKLMLYLIIKIESLVLNTTISSHLALSSLASAEL